VALGVLEDLVELGDVHSVSIMDKMRHRQACFTSLIDDGSGLLNHPLAVWFETAGRTEDTPCTDMQEGQHKRLPQAGRRPDQLAEEVDLPERFDVDLEKLIPTASPPLGTGLDALLFEDVLDGRFRDRVNPQLLEFAENLPIAPASSLAKRMMRLRTDSKVLGLPIFLGFLPRLFSRTQRW
jgi:hypothetical protein